MKQKGIGMTDNEQEIFLSDASDKVKGNLLTYWNSKLNLSLGQEDIVCIFNDEPFSWGSFELYDFSTNESCKSIDTVDRGVLNEWLWARLMGEEFPDFPDEEDVQRIYDKLNEKNWQQSLFSWKDVRNKTLKRFKTSDKFRVRLMPTVPDPKHLPEIIKIEGNPLVVEAVMALIDKYREELDEVLIASNK